MTQGHVNTPGLFPTWIWMMSPVDTVNHLRGGPFFRRLHELGFKVQFVQGESVEEMDESCESFGADIEINSPWTFIFFAEVPVNDLTQTFADLAHAPCSIIIDCHHPLVDIDEDVSYYRFRDVMLRNLSMAHAVTTSKPEWATQLVDYNENVFNLADCPIDIDTMNDHAQMGSWVLTFNEVAAIAQQVRMRRSQEVAALNAQHQVHRRRRPGLWRRIRNWFNDVFSPPEGV